MSNKTDYSHIERYDLETFIEEFTESLLEGDEEYVFFIGAGTSVSSEIPAASSAVDQWLRELFDKKGSNFKAKKGHQHPAHIQWGIQKFRDVLDENDPNLANAYSTVFENLSRGRPGAILDLTSKQVEGKDPGPGYATLAKMMTEKKFSHRCNNLLTTNFDDLIADACYLFTRKKPLTINDPAMLGYLKQNNKNPVILKLHGDAKTTPLQLEKDINGQLDPKYKAALKELLSDKGIIFVGYGGHDQTVIDLLEETNPGYHVYWIGSSLPETGLTKWLDEKSAIWVEHRDFDELMLLLHERLDIDYPDWQRFKNLETKYHKHFNEQADKTTAKSSNPKTKKTAQKAKDDSKAWKVVHELLDIQNQDSDEAIKAYENALKEFPDFVHLIGNYANFLFDLDHLKEAEEHYLTALEIDPDHLINNCNYIELLLVQNRKKESLGTVDKVFYPHPN